MEPYIVAPGCFKRIHAESQPGVVGHKVKARLDPVSQDHLSIRTVDFVTDRGPLQKLESCHSIGNLEGEYSVSGSKCFIDLFIQLYLCILLYTNTYYRTKGTVHSMKKTNPNKHYKHT